jgi:hypothetical protein
MASHRPVVRLRGGQAKGIRWVPPRMGILSARGLCVRASVKAAFPTVERPRVGIGYGRGRALSALNRPFLPASSSFLQS